MTYFEWVQIFKRLETSPMDEDLLKQLDNKTLDGGEYVGYQIIKHISNTINVRINNAFGKMLKNIKSSDLDVNLFELELISLKKEFSFCKMISKLSIISIDYQKEFDNTIDNVINDMYDMLKRKIDYIDVNGEYINILEKNK